MCQGFFETGLYLISFESAFLFHTIYLYLDVWTSLFRLVHSEIPIGNPKRGNPFPKGIPFLDISKIEQKKTKSVEVENSTYALLVCYHFELLQIIAQS